MRPARSQTNTATGSWSSRTAPSGIKPSASPVSWANVPGRLRGASWVGAAAADAAGAAVSSVINRGGISEMG